MIKANLNSKNEEIFSKIPNTHRQLLINSILTRSLENGSFIKELSFFMSSTQVEEILSQIEIPDITIKKKSSYYSKNKAQKDIKEEIKKSKKEEEDNTGAFIGFDH